jgi:hypothetical protein
MMTEGFPCVMWSGIAMFSRLLTINLLVFRQEPPFFDQDK